MAARSETLINLVGASPFWQEAHNRPSAVVMKLRRSDAHGRPVIDQASGDVLGAGRGLMLGIILGALLWLCIGSAAWELLHH